MKDRRDPTLRDRRKLLPRGGGRRASDPPPALGFPCPHCHHPRTVVVDGKPRPNRRGYRRRRLCEACGEKFWTFEALDAA